MVRIIKGWKVCVFFSFLFFGRLLGVCVLNKSEDENKRLGVKSN